MDNVTITYYDGNQWQPSWDTTEQTNLPNAIKVQIQLVAVSGVAKPSPLEVVVPVRSADHHQSHPHDGPVMIINHTACPARGHSCPLQGTGRALRGIGVSARRAGMGLSEAVGLGRRRAREAASVLIIIMWIAFGLVAVSLYFAHSMSAELQASDNRVAAMEANQAIEGYALYLSNILINLQYPNSLPNIANYHAENVQIGNAHVWAIGRDSNAVPHTTTADHPFWGLVAEASRINLNVATPEQLQWLPGLSQFAVNEGSGAYNVIDAIYDWRTTTTTPTNGGAKSETYSILTPPYLCKETNFETEDELRMVYGMTPDILYGEDANLNGVLDPNENDGSILPPVDNKDGILNPGLLEYVTVWSHEGSTISNGIARACVTNINDIAGIFSNYFPQFMDCRVPFESGAGGGGGGGEAGGGGGGRGGGGGAGGGGRGGGGGGGGFGSSGVGNTGIFA